MPGLADRLRAEDREAVGALTPDQRLALAFALGARDLDAFRMAQEPPLDAATARRLLERRRQAGRRRCRCVEELIG